MYCPAGGCIQFSAGEGGLVTEYLVFGIGGGVAGFGGGCCGGAGFADVAGSVGEDFAGLGGGESLAASLSGGCRLDGDFGKRRVDGRLGERFFVFDSRRRRRVGFVVVADSVFLSLGEAEGVGAGDGRAGAVCLRPSFVCWSALASNAAAFGLGCVVGVWTGG